MYMLGRCIVRNDIVNVVITLLIDYIKLLSVHVGIRVAIGNRMSSIQW